MQRPRAAAWNAALRCWLANAFGALALALLAVAHVLPVLHFTLVAHELCAEHGALHHVEARRLESAARPLTLARGHAVSASAHASHEHDHCGVLSTTAERSLLPARVEVAARFSDGTYHAVRLQPRDAQPSLALLDYAPKLAPPA